MYPVSFAADYVEGRSRVTTFFRLILAIPHMIVLALFGIVTAICVVIAWFAIVITGQYPRGLYDLVARFILYATQATAYVTLLTDAYPSFGGSEQYPIRMTFAGPLEPYDRLKTGFRFILAWLSGKAEAPEIVRGSMPMIVALALLPTRTLALRYTYSGPRSQSSPERAAPGPKRCEPPTTAFVCATASRDPDRRSSLLRRRSPDRAWRDRRLVRDRDHGQDAARAPGRSCARSSYAARTDGYLFLLTETYPPFREDLQAVFTGTTAAQASDTPVGVSDPPAQTGDIQ